MTKLCSRCQEEISRARLDVRPFARLCTRCQEENDVPRHTALSRVVARALVESSLDDLTEMGRRTREVREGD